MFTPTLGQVKTLAEREDGNLVPIYAEIPAGLETPLSAYLKIVRGPYSFLLESVEGGERQARYTFIGTEPYKILKTGPGTESGSIDPLLLVEKELSNYRTIPIKGLPRFLGGAIGYLAYECVRYFEPRVPAAIADPLAVPEAVLMFTDTVLVFDHMNSVIKVVSHVQTNGDIDTAYENATERINKLISRLKRPNPSPAQPTRSSSEAKSNETSSNFNQTEYENVVRQCKAYIVNGDIIQVVPSRRIAQATSAAPLDIYRSLRSLNPSPYMYFLTLDDFHIIGASPEALVRVEDGIVYNYPLAGTFPRGRTPEEDEALAIELRNDKKERAEHIMLVDLGRNDVGRVSETGTVEVTDLMRVVRYSHVMHLESEVRGRLRADQTIYDALRSCLPAGTLSGAPKIRAMEIIAEMELQRRGPYGGAIGYFGFQGNMDTAIPIRTIVLKDGIAYIQAGGGVVYDSLPEQEYQETVNKAQAPLRAIEQAEAAEQC